MVDETELQSVQFLEQVKFEMEANMLRIKQRTLETLTANFNGAMDSLKNYYFSCRNKDRRFPLLPLSRDRVLRDLDKKAKLFDAFFTETVFSKVIHASGKDLPQNEDGTVTIKSFEKIRSDSVLQSQDITKHQRDMDEKIGSNGLVFANNAALLSRSCGGTYVYEIESRDACVIPIDVADQLNPISIDEVKYGDALTVYFLSKNIFSSTDFKTFFSTYASILFETPQEALSFFKRNYLLPLQAGVWTSDEETKRCVHQEGDKETALKIRKLYAENGIVPPFSPEWQFKDEVKARKIKWDSNRF